jgi:hypothetical protein
MRAHNAKARARHTGGSAAGASQARIAARGTVANDTPVNTVSTLEYPPAGRCASATNRHEGTRTPSASDRDLTRHTHWVGTRGYSQVLADGMGGASNRTVGREGSDTRQRELELGIEVLQRLHLRAFVLGRRRHLHSTKAGVPAGRRLTSPNGHAAARRCALVRSKWAKRTAVRDPLELSIRRRIDRSITRQRFAIRSSRR